METSVQISSFSSIAPSYSRICLSDSMLEQLSHLPTHTYKYIYENRRAVVVIAVGTAIVCITCGGVYVIMTAAAAGGAVTVTAASQSLVSWIGSCVGQLNPYCLTAGSVAIISGISIPCLYRSWRMANAERIDRRLLEIPQEMAERMKEDDLLNQYTCPLALVPSDNPIKIQEGSHVWYFDQELITSWYDRCVSARRTPYNPLTMHPLPFQKREDIFVDETARLVIRERLSMHQRTSAEN